MRYFSSGYERYCGGGIKGNVSQELDSPEFIKTGSCGKAAEIYSFGLSVFAAYFSTPDSHRQYRIIGGNPKKASGRPSIKSLRFRIQTWTAPDFSGCQEIQQILFSIH